MDHNTSGSTRSSRPKRMCTKIDFGNEHEIERLLSTNSDKKNADYSDCKLQ